jgi:hypothetical protein
VNKNHFSFAVISFLALVLLSSVSSACIGMDAAKIHLNISAGSSATGQMIIFNTCDNPINFDTGGAIDRIINQTTPTLITSPAHGVLGVREQLPINITVNMPANATPGTEWSGAAAVMEVSNNSRAGGANFQVGVRTSIKVTTLVAVPTNYLVYEILAIAVVIVLLVIFFILRKRKAAKGGEKKPAKGKKKPAATRKPKAAKRRKR